MRVLCAFMLVAGLAACGGRSSTAEHNAAAGPSSRAKNVATVAAIKQFVLAEDDGFAHLKRGRIGDASVVTKYRSSLQIPLSNLCLITVINNTGNHIAACFFVASSELDARLTYSMLKLTAGMAVPALRGHDETPTNDRLAQYYATDGRHAYYIDASRERDRYIASIEFGRPAALR